MSFLLDTNVVSEAMRTEPEPSVLQWLEEHQADCYLSVITLGELEKGLAILPAGTKRKRLLKAYEIFLESAEGRILAFDQTVARRWALLTGTWQRKGRRLSVLDSMIEATALQWNLTLVTRNLSDFAEVPLINPWNIRL